MEKLIKVIFVLFLTLVCLFSVLLFIPLMQVGDKTEVWGSESWMANINGGRKINEISIPGTHDSAANYCQLGFFTKCQTGDIETQLRQGCRYLDIRLGISEKDGEPALRLLHSVMECRESVFGGTLYLDAVLDDCYSFLDKHPTETVLFVVKKEDKAGTVEEFERLLDSYIQQNPNKWLLCSELPTLNECRGRLVLFRRYTDEAELGESSGIHFDWKNQGGSSDTRPNIESNKNETLTLFVQDRYEYNDAEKWLAFTAGLETTNSVKGGGNVCVSFLSTKGPLPLGHPYSYAQKLNKALLNEEFEKDQFLGWVILDFPSAPLAKKIYSQN